MISPIYSTIMGDSSDVMAAIFSPQLTYAPKPGSVIADMTYGRGVFWKKIDAAAYTIVGADIVPKEGVSLLQDARQPALRDGACDVVVLDPPFGNGSTTPRTRMQSGYELHSLRTPKEITHWYWDAMDAAFALLRPKGLLIVKCMDIVDSGKQRWITMAVMLRAMDHEAIDRFTMVPRNQPTLRHPDRPQQHARKWGSTFWVFRRKK